MPAYFFIKSMREHGPLIWLPAQAGTPSHLPSSWPRYLTVPLTAPSHDVADRLEQFGIAVWIPCRHRKDVVTRLRLRFRGHGQQELVTLAGDVVDLDFDLLPFGPLIDQIGGGLVGAGNPMVPEAYRQFAGRVRGSHIRRRNQCGG
jgi:hypothetical protein